jgi:glycosylphosphatidylinositol transamidase (GPIT) subunit GPI8
MLKSIVMFNREHIDNPLFPGAVTDEHRRAISYYREQLGMVGSGMEPATAAEAALLMKGYSQKLIAHKRAKCKNKKAKPRKWRTND